MGEGGVGWGRGGRVGWGVRVAWGGGGGAVGTTLNTLARTVLGTS